MNEQFRYLLFWTPGPMELIIILIIAVLIFGRRLPEIARGLGKSLTEFKKGINEAKRSTDELTDEVRDVKTDLSNRIDDAASSKDSASSEPDRQ